MERPIQSPDEGVMPPERCSVAGSSDPSRKEVGTSGRPNKNPVRIWPFGFGSELFQTRGKLKK